LHLITHPPGGWLRWRDDLPDKPPRPARARSRSGSGRGGSGFDLTEAGTRKRLAVYLAEDPAQVPGIASLGPDPLADSFTAETLAGLLGKRTRSRVCSGTRRSSRNRQRLLRRGPARGEDPRSSWRPAHPGRGGFTSTGDARLPEGGRGQVGRAGAGELKAEKQSGLRVHGRRPALPVCGDTVREVSGADSALQYCPACQTGGKPLADRRMSRLLK
jgi:formamidopyrimidine-DNA glycosylase